MAKSLFQKILNRFMKQPASDFPTLEPGDNDPLALGTEYNESLLKELYNQTKGARTLLTLTPICQYQIDKKWPEPPFVNVNLHGSVATEKNNWLGFIPNDDPLGINLEKIIQSQGNVNVHASIHKDRGQYWIQFYISDKYKVDPNTYIKTYISHDKNQAKLVKDISCETNKDYIRVDMKKTPDNKQYLFTYNGKIIGTASCKKIDDCIDGASISDTLLSIKKFRFDDDSDNKHYSTLIIFKEI